MTSQSASSDRFRHSFSSVSKNAANGNTQFVESVWSYYGVHLGHPGWLSGFLPALHLCDPWLETHTGALHVDWVLSPYFWSPSSHLKLICLHHLLATRVSSDLQVLVLVAFRSLGFFLWERCNATITNSLSMVLHQQWLFSCETDLYIEPTIPLLTVSVLAFFCIFW